MKQKMHIVILDFDDIKNPLLSGGQARATFEVAKRLVDLGNKVTVICSRFPNSKDIENNGVIYRHIGFGSSNIKLNNAIFFLALPFAVAKLKADVIIECFTAPISTCFSPIFTKIPVIGMPTMFEAKEFAKKYHIPFHFVEALGARFYKYFLAYSQLNKLKMEELNPKIFTKIIPNGVSEDMLKVKTKEGNYGIFIGRIDVVQKGLDLLIDACRRFPKKLNMKIVIAGNGPTTEENKLKSLIQKNKLSDIVSFVGRVDGDLKEKLLANSMFGIYTSRFEDFPLVPLEYASFGKPLICFDVPGLLWVPEKVSIKVKPFDTAKFADALTSIVSNKNLRDKKKSHCRSFAKKYGWDAIAKKYEEFCYEVIRMEAQNKKGANI